MAPLRARAGGSGGASPLLRVEGLRVLFGRGDGADPLAAVDGVDFEIAEGRSVGLVGESGCGKTVTALSLVGLLPGSGRVDRGSSICYRGEELVGASEGRLRRLRGAEIGLVFQEPATALDPVMPVGEQIAEVVRAHGGVGRRAARARVVDLLTEVGIRDPAERAHAYPHQLSGGMRQRVVVAAALAGDPSLLVADEPTTALDVTVQAQILTLLADLRERRDMALLLISHDLDVVADVCETVMVMYAGELAEVAPAHLLFARPEHPYTRGLLASLPRPGTSGARLRPVPGRVPSPDARPSGCRFAERCPHAWARCRAQHPPLLATGGRGGRARCWLVEEPSRRDGP
ncbi:MAG: ABC transporter ATP-binding protein [Gemmatimonadota bacterium]